MTAMRTKLLPVLLFILFVPSAASLGVAPSNIDLGDIRPGETREVTIYVTSSRSSPFQARVAYDDPLTSDIWSGQMLDPEQYSEQDIEDWVRFEERTILVDPLNSSTAVIGDGSVVKANGGVTFYISVPEDAEPGYRAGSLDIVPQLGGGSGSGATVVAQAVPQFFFRVPGPADRQVRIDQVRAFRTGQEEVRIDLSIQNIGTVTTTVDESDVYINRPGEGRVGATDAGVATIGPGEYETLTTYWNADAVEGGTYRAETEVSWITGSMTRSASFSIPDRVEIVPAEQAPGNQPTGSEGEQQPLPMWLIAMTLVVLAVLMYSFDIAPIWIFATVGLVGISGFILMSSVTNVLLAVPLLIFAATVYLV